MREQVRTFLLIPITQRVQQSEVECWLCGYPVRRPKGWPRKGSYMCQQCVDGWPIKKEVTNARTQA